VAAAEQARAAGAERAIARLLRSFGRVGLGRGARLTRLGHLLRAVGGAPRAQNLGASPEERRAAAQRSAAGRTAEPSRGGKARAHGSAALARITATRGWQTAGRAAERLRYQAATPRGSDPRIVIGEAAAEPGASAASDRSRGDDRAGGSGLSQGAGRRATDRAGRRKREEREVAARTAGRRALVTVAATVGAAPRAGSGARRRGSWFGGVAAQLRRGGAAADRAQPGVANHYSVSGAPRPADARPGAAARGATVSAMSPQRLNRTLERLAAGRDGGGDELFGRSGRRATGARGAGPRVTPGNAAAPSTTVNYTPTIVVNQGEPDDLRHRLLSILEQHAYELQEILEREAARRQRAAF